MVPTRHRTLRQHREALAANPNAYVSDKPRFRDTVIGHLKQCSFNSVSRGRCAPLIDHIVDAIFETQDQRPFFHIDDALPFCWNAPKDWDKDYIRYEWGHLRSRNQNVDAHAIENLCLQSARCNQHIQTSMDINEVLDWLDGSRVAVRVREVLKKRDRLFASEAWRALLDELERHR